MNEAGGEIEKGWETFLSEVLEGASADGRTISEEVIERTRVIFYCGATCFYSIVTNIMEEGLGAQGTAEVAMALAGNEGTSVEKVGSALMRMGQLEREVKAFSASMVDETEAKVGEEREDA